MNYTLKTFLTEQYEFMSDLNLISGNK